jgi:hypothetical protein
VSNFSEQFSEQFPRHIASTLSRGESLLRGVHLRASAADSAGSFLPGNAVLPRGCWQIR